MKKNFVSAMAAAVVAFSAPIASAATVQVTTEVKKDDQMMLEKCQMPAHKDSQECKDFMSKQKASENESKN